MKYFHVTIKPVKSFNPNAEELAFYTKQKTAAAAKKQGQDYVAALGPIEVTTDKGMKKLWKVPIATEVSEQDYIDNYREEQLESPTLSDGLTQPTKIWPELGDDGFFDEKHSDIEESTYIHSSEPLAAAKVFILHIGVNEWSYGFKYKHHQHERLERMNLDCVESSREKAIDAAINKLTKFTEVLQEFGDPNQLGLIEAIKVHDFGYAFLGPIDKIMQAINAHRDVENALSQHPNFIATVDDNLSSLLPHDINPDPIIEHINTMMTIGVLSDLSACEESFKHYLPKKPLVQPTEKTKAIMANIEATIANALTGKVWHAPLVICDGVHVMVAAKDCGDEGYTFSYQAYNNGQSIFGDENTFSDHFYTTRMEAVKAAGELITDDLNRYDSSMSLGHRFSQSSFVEDFEAKCVVLHNPAKSQIKSAIKQRLQQRTGTVMDAKEVDFALDNIMPSINVDTDIDALCEAIINLEHCKPLWDKETCAELVARACSNDTPPDAPQHFIPTDKHELIVYQSLQTIDDYHLVPSPEQYEEAGEKLSAVMEEAKQVIDGFDVDATLSDLLKVDWDSGNDALKTYLNLRTLRRFIRENAAVSESAVTHSEPENSIEAPVNHQPKSHNPDNEATKPKAAPEPEKPQSLPDPQAPVLQQLVSKEAANEPNSIPDIELDHNNINMKVWNAGFKTDLKHTKQDPSSSRLSINAQYRQMKATSIFGPRGKGWGVDIVREWIEESAPILINGENSGFFESEHHIEILLWYIHPDDGQRYAVIAYGETDRMYWSNNYKRLIKNKEFRKKSLTDATGKALSMLGICGDVYMGEYDDQEIINRTEIVKMAEKGIKRIEHDDHVADTAIQKAKTYTDKLPTAPSLAEIKRLEKLAIASLEAYPSNTDEFKTKKQKLLDRIAQQVQQAIADFSQDLEKHKETSNDK